MDPTATRAYTWEGWDSEAPPGVFMPGSTSRMIHERLLDGRIEVRGRRYGAMGAGPGVEAVAAVVRGVRESHAFDIHAESVDTADLRTIVRDTLDQGFAVEIDHLDDRGDGVLTFLFRPTRGARS